MSNEQELTINGIVYVAKNSTAPVEIGTKQIVIADRGWVFIGDVEERPDGLVTIYNAKNIRRWGTTKGLGELHNGPLKDTVLDDYGTVVTTFLSRIAVNPEKW